jgi:uncharacterized protein (TIGR03435 family)
VYLAGVRSGPARVPSALLLAVALAHGQTPAGEPRFESGAIRLHTETGRAQAARRRIDPGRIEILGASLPQLIRTAYRLEPYQNIAGPDWIKRSYYDVFGKLGEDASRAQIPEMLQALLADQLKLVVRRETQLEPVCRLTVGKNGPKLKQVAAGDPTEVTIPHSDRQIQLTRRKTSQGYVTYSRLNSVIVLDATRITLPELAALLRQEVNMPVLDRTGLPGFYQLTVFVPGAWMRARHSSAQTLGDAPEPAGEPSVVPVASEPEGVNLFKSIQRLGLKLEKSKAPVEHLVVESAMQDPEKH